MNELSAALTNAHACFGPIVKNKKVHVRTKTGGSYEFAYAALDTIMAAVRKPLSDNGLCLSQSVETNQGHDAIVTTLIHASGQTLANRVPLFASGDGAQAYGSGITYARRYGVTLILCLVADEDDDGNAADGNAVKTIEPDPMFADTEYTPPPMTKGGGILAEVRTLAESIGFDAPDIRDWANYKHAQAFAKLTDEQQRVMHNELVAKVAVYKAICELMNAEHGGIPDGLTEAQQCDRATVYIREKAAVKPFDGKPLRAPFAKWKEWAADIETSFFKENPK